MGGINFKGWFAAFGFFLGLAAILFFGGGHGWGAWLIFTIFFPVTLVWGSALMTLRLFMCGVEEACPSFTWFADGYFPVAIFLVLCAMEFWLFGIAANRAKVSVMRDLQIINGE